MDALTQQLRRLASASPTITTLAAVGICKALATTPLEFGLDVKRKAITACLMHSCKEVVGEVIRCMLVYKDVTGVSVRDWTDMLLNAIVSAGVSNAELLADGLVALLQSNAGQGVLPEGVWSSHPLSAALLSSEAAGPQLVAAACRALAPPAADPSVAHASAARGGGQAAQHAASGSGGDPARTASPQQAPGGSTGADEGQLAVLWAALAPFFSFILLQRHTSTGSSGAARTGPPLSAGPPPPPSSFLSWAPGHLSSTLCGVALARGRTCGLQRRVLGLMMARLDGCLLQDPLARLAAGQCAEQTVDILEALLQHEGNTTLVEPNGACPDPLHSNGHSASVTSRMLQLCREMQHAGGTIQSLVSQLHRLHDLQPAVLAAHLPAVALLCSGASAQEREALFLLLHKVLHGDRGSSSPAPPGHGTFIQPAGPERLLLWQPVIMTLAFGSPPSHKAWASHLLCLMRRQPAPCLPPPAAPPGVHPGVPLWRGELCLLAHATAHCHHTWQEEQATPASPTPVRGGTPGGQAHTVRWLRAVEASVRLRRQALDRRTAAELSSDLPELLQPGAAAISNGGAALSVAGAAGLAPTAVMLLGAMLAHDHPLVCQAACGALREVVLLIPHAALDFLPLLVYCLQAAARRATNSINAEQPDDCSRASPQDARRAVSATEEDVPARLEVPEVASSRPSSVALARSQLYLLRVLPAMAGSDAAITPFALRILQPLLEPGSPEVCRALGLRLMLDMWLETGKGWQRLEAALCGLGRPLYPLPLLLRVTQAQAVLEVCCHDPHRGVDLVSALQQALADPSPQVAALGLRALDKLCAADVLDFYQAWKVVHRWHPSLPAAAVSAVPWVALLQHGALDAAAHPDKAPALVGLLRGALAHTDQQVCSAAGQALAAYPIEVLERLEVDPPLDTYVGALVTATVGVEGAAPDALAGLEALAASALKHEHEHRRRLMLAAPAVAAPTARRGAAPASAASERACAAVRRRLVHKLPDMVAAAARHQGATAGATDLLLHCTASPRVAAAAGGDSARQRRGDERLLEDAVGRSPAWSCLTHPALAGHSWARFLARWSEPAAQPGTTHDVYASLTRHLGGEGTPAPSLAACEGAVMAVGALCCSPAGPPGGAAASGLSDSQVSDAVRRLQCLVNEDRSAAIVRAALLSLAQLASRLHPMDHATRASILDTCQQQLCRPDASPVVRGAAALATATVAATTATTSNPGPRARPHGAGWAAGRTPSGGAQETISPAAIGLSRSLSLLFGSLVSVCPQHVASAFAMVEAAPAWLGALQVAELGSMGNEDMAGDAGEDTVVGVLGGLAVLACSVSEGQRLPLAEALYDLLSQIIEASATPPGTAEWTSAGAMGGSRPAVGELMAAAVTLPMVVSTLRRSAPAFMTADQLRKDMSHLLSICFARTTDGRVPGAAAAAAGALLALCIQDVSGTDAGTDANEVGSSSTAADAQPFSMLAATMVAPVVQTLVQCATSAGERDASAGPHATAVRCGAAAGLAALLLPPSPGASWLSPGLLLHTSVANTSAWAVEPPPLVCPTYAASARSALEALEGLALRDADTRVAATACWWLAAACDAARLAEHAHGGAHMQSTRPSVMQGDPPGGTASPGDTAGGGMDDASSSAGGAAPRPLSQYREDGALRPLVEALRGPQLYGMAPQVMAAGVRCLACTPRLATLDWASLARRVLDAASAASAFADAAAPVIAVHVAVVDLALAHAHSPAGMGLAALLDDMLVPQHFQLLPRQVAGHLLTHLPDVVRRLATTRAMALLEGLPALVAGHRQYSSDEPLEAPSAEGMDLEAAAWAGLAALSTSCKPPAKQMSASASTSSHLSPQLLPLVLQTIRTLFRRLPPLHTLWAGEVAVLRDRVLATPNQSRATALTTTRSTDPAVQTPEGPSACALHVWEQAARCTMTLSAADMVDLTTAPSAPQSASPTSSSSVPCAEEVSARRSAQMRCLMALTGGVSWRDVAAVQRLVLTCDSATAAVVMPLLAPAVATAPQSAQVQILLDTLRAAQLASTPLPALHLVAALVHSWLATTSPGAFVTTALASSQTTQRPPQPQQPPQQREQLPGLLDVLPYTLPALLGTKLWISAAAPVAAALLPLWAATTTAPPSEHPGPSSGGSPSLGRPRPEVAGAGGVRAVLLAMRQSLDPLVWDAVARLCAATTHD